MENLEDSPWPFSLSFLSRQESYPADCHNVWVTTEHESGAMVSGATDAFRLAGLIRACRLLPDGRWIPLRKGHLMWGTCRWTRPRTDEPHEA